MSGDLFLAIDVGTGSVRAALVDLSGKILHIASREHDQIVPAFGWSEQRPLDWWDGAKTSVAAVLGKIDGAASRVAMICVCGQMHGTVMLDADGRLTRDTAPLWNDKRTIELVRRFEEENEPGSYLSESGNTPTPAWPGFKLQWIRDNDPAAYARTAVTMMPKDYINFRLTGEIAMDRTDASCSFLMNPESGAWSSRMIERMGLDSGKLPPIRDPLDVIGSVTATAALETGLRSGTPVMVGGGDYPVSLLGSGVCEPGVGSDSTGTGAIVTMIAEKPLLDPEISNVATIEGNWAPFVLLETGGDGMRWARRAFHDKSLSYDQIVARAETAPAGSDALFFLPFLTGERLGKHRNARAQFFGLGAAHGMQHLHRSVLEGIAFAVARHIRIMESASGLKLERVIASGGGARTALWLTDQGERLQHTYSRTAGGRVRYCRLRGDGSDGRWPFRQSRSRR